MADIDAEMNANLDTDSKDIKDKAKDTISSNRRGFGIGAGIGTAAALFTTGYMIGHKRAESQTMYSKILRHISDMK